MYKRYYDGYGTLENENSPNSGELVIPRECTEEDNAQCSCKTTDNGAPAVCCQPTTSAGALPTNGLSKVFNNLAIDDVILFGVILLVLKDSVDDPLLIIILTVVFISGFVEI